MAQCGNEYMGYFEPKEPVWVNVLAFYGIPKSVTKKQRAEMETGVLRPTRKPDVDNVGKICVDPLVGYAMPDDSQIVEMHVSKHYSHEPHVVVILSNEPLKGEPEWQTEITE